METTFLSIEKYYVERRNALMSYGGNLGRSLYSVSQPGNHLNR